jgi:hypothetical protein
MTRVAPTPANGSTDLVTVKTYVDIQWMTAVRKRGKLTGLGTSGYLRQLILRDLEAGRDGHRWKPPTNWPSGRTKSVKAYVDVPLWDEVCTRADVIGVSDSRYLLGLVLKDSVDSKGSPLWAASSPTAVPLPGMEAAA